MEDLIQCKSCKHVQEYRQGYFKGKVDSYPKITQVGMRCLGCGIENVAYYTNPKLQEMEIKVGVLKGRAELSQKANDKYQHYLTKYEKLLLKYQKSVRRIHGII